MSGPTAFLPPTNAPTTARTSPPALLSASSVKPSAATARPWYGTDLITDADRKNVTDSGIRKREDWI